MEALELDDRADPSLPGRWRRPLGSWVEAAGGGPALVERVVLAVNEALSNAVEHGYRETAPGTVCLRARVGTPSLGATGAEDAPGAPGPHRMTLVVVVADHGRWRPPVTASACRGRGLAMIRALAESVDLASSAEGTTVRMTWTLLDPA
ncbi:MAG TPA: ATP-binding protein [Actinomycetospora sp.]|nr:ATP-binding protein [Actinomycetospora sp.]